MTKTTKGGVAWGIVSLVLASACDSSGAKGVGEHESAAGGDAAAMPARSDADASADADAERPLAGGPTLFYLDVLGKVRRASADGSDARAIVEGQGVAPDGIDVDVARGHVYWTNMGAVAADDGTIMRADLDGRNVVTIVKAGGTFTPKQLKLDTEHDKLYWSDREGMRVMRANLDGTELETLVITGDGAADRADASHWCVGIALDVARGELYFTQKGGDDAHQGMIQRVPMELPAGMDPAARSDLETLFSGLPEPIDLDLDLAARTLYWSDRGDNTISRAPLDPEAGFDPEARDDREILVTDLAEAIGLSLDVPRGRMYYTSLASGVVGSAKLDGSDAQDLITGQGALTGIVVADLPE